MDKSQTSAISETSAGIPEVLMALANGSNPVVGSPCNEPSKIRAVCTVTLVTLGEVLSNPVITLALNT